MILVFIEGDGKTGSRLTIGEKEIPDGAYLYRDGRHIRGGELGADPAFASHRHAGQTLKHIGVNSVGGAFAFDTTGAVTFNQLINAASASTFGNLTLSDGEIKSGSGILSFDNENLITTGNITVAFDTNSISYFGRCALGYANQNNRAAFSHVDQTGTAGYAIKQGPTGGTDINSATGTEITFNYQNVYTAKFTTSRRLYVAIQVPLSTGSTFVALDSAEVQRFNNTATNAPNITFTRARGTESVPVAVINTIETGRFLFRGYDGVGPISSARFGAVVDGVVGVGDVPQAIYFKTGNTAAAAERWRITSDGDLQAFTDNLYIKFGDLQDSGITDDGSNLNFDSDLLAAGSRNFIFNSGYLRTATTKYRRYYHFSVAGFTPGLSGATWIPSDANTLCGWKLDNVNEVIEDGGLDAHSDWDGASDIVIELPFTVNIDNTGGNVGDTVDIVCDVFFKKSGDTACKNQTIEVSVVVGQCAQYTQFKAEFTIDYDDVGDPVVVGDRFCMNIHLETDTSEVDNITVHGGSFHYNTTHIGIEDNDT